MFVIKRDGRKVEFDSSKIANAVIRAFNSVYSNNLTDEMTLFAQRIADDVAEKNSDMSVEDIQNIVIKKLMASKYKEVATAYVEYKHLHEMARSQYAALMDAVGEKLSGKNIENQNANVDEHSFGGRIGEATRIVTKQFALEYLISPMARANHENNEIYIHDLDNYAVGNHNCLSIPFDDLLANGFNTRQTDVRPAQSINTAFQLVAVIFQLQSLQQFGGVSATHLDWTMVPYVRKSFSKHWYDGMKYCVGEEITYHAPLGNEEPIESDFYKSRDSKAYEYAMDMTTKECYQAVEGMYHNLNTLQSRSGNQLKMVAG